MADLRLVAAALAASLAFIVVRYAEAADAWTCTYPLIASPPNNTAFIRFEIASPDLIETKREPPDLLWSTPLGTHYRILQNNEYGLVATFSVAEQSAVGESSVVINKTTGEFLFADALTGKEVMEEEEDGTVKALSKFNHGKCLHD